MKNLFGKECSQDLEQAGAPQPPPPAPTLAQIKQAAEAQIDEFMKKVGITDPATLTDEHGWRFFGLGSAISDEMVFVAVTRPVMELHSVARCIQSVMSIADDVDDVLIEKYGGTSKKRIPADSTSQTSTPKGRKRQ